jgi:DNA-binding MarR family transcriptional regulator
MGGLTGDLGFLLARVSAQVTRATNAALAEAGVRVRQYSVLALACDTPDGVTQRDLAQVLGLDPSQVVALVDELADAGLVIRSAPEADRRTRIVAPTGAGREARDRTAALADRAVGASLSALSPEDQATLRSLLIRVLSLPPAGQPDSGSLGTPWCA